MDPKLLLINFRYSVSSDEYRETAIALASTFASVKGLRWKVWTINESENSAGGIYLFDGQDSLDNFLASPLADQVKGHPAFSEMTAAPFDVIAEATATTRGPV